MSDQEDLDALAGEYVLGTLDAAERNAVSARRQREPALDRAIVDWEARLAPLQDLPGDIAPPDDVLQRIEATIDVLGTRREVVDISRRLRRWRVATFVTGAVAACALLVAGGEFALRPATPQNFVAVLTKDKVSPAFLVQVDIATRQLTIRPVKAERTPGKSYELWLVNARYDTPKSLGVIGNAEFTTSARLASYSSEEVESSVLAVSLEPEGGSPTGKPTGPVLFTGQLIQSTP